MTSPDTPAPTISQDVPAPAAVTAEMVRKAKQWRKPTTMPLDGSPVIVGYRWRAEVRATLGCWHKGDEAGQAGVIEYPGGCYLPCIGWMPLPTGGHEPHLPLCLPSRAALQGADNHE